MFLRLGLSLLAAVLVGCAGPRKWQPSHDYNALDRAQFIHYLAAAPVVTVEEGVRAVLLLADGEDSLGSYDERIAELGRRGVVRDAWSLRPSHTLDKGTLAYMLFKTCRMPGGVNTLLLGSWGLGDRRYALREVVAEGILADGPDTQPVKGGELAAALGRADSYMAEHGLYESTERRIDSPADLGTTEGAK